jgi:inosose dehydratase
MCRPRRHSACEHPFFILIDYSNKEYGMSWNVRIGINPISWMNDDLPELGGETPLETALSEGKEIGYAGFELGNKFAKDGPGLKAQLDAYQLACVSG